jgi:hypothetical protein
MPHRGGQNSGQGNGNATSRWLPGNVTGTPAGTGEATAPGEAAGTNPGTRAGDGTPSLTRKTAPVFHRADWKGTHCDSESDRKVEGHMVLDYWLFVARPG